MGLSVLWGGSGAGAGEPVVAADEVVGAAVGSGGADVDRCGGRGVAASRIRARGCGGTRRAGSGWPGRWGRRGPNGVRWWQSHQLGGRSQPGNRHVLSRSSTARRSAVGTTRVSRPMSRGWLREPSRTGMMPASQASRRAVSAQIGSPGWPSSAGPPGRSGSPRPASTSLMRSVSLSPEPRRRWRSEPPRPRLCAGRAAPDPVCVGPCGIRVLAVRDRRVSAVAGRLASGCPRSLRARPRPVGRVGGVSAGVLLGEGGGEGFPGDGQGDVGGVGAVAAAGFAGQGGGADVGERVGAALPGGAAPARRGRGRG